MGEHHETHQYGAEEQPQERRRWAPHYADTGSDCRDEHDVGVVQAALDSAHRHLKGSILGPLPEAGWDTRLAWDVLDLEPISDVNNVFDLDAINKNDFDSDTDQSIIESGADMEHSVDLDFEVDLDEKPRCHGGMRIIFTGTSADQS